MRRTNTILEGKIHEEAFDYHCHVLCFGYCDPGFRFLPQQDRMQDQSKKDDINKDEMGKDDVKKDKRSKKMKKDKKDKMDKKDDMKKDKPQPQS